MEEVGRGSARPAGAQTVNLVLVPHPVVPVMGEPSRGTRRPRGHRRAGLRAGLTLVAAAILLTACGLQTDAAEARTTRELRTEVQKIVDDARLETADLVSPTLDHFEGRITSSVPAEPDGHLLYVRPEADNTRVVTFALDSKYDETGFGGGTRSVRMCVAVTVTTSPRVSDKIDDTDCPDLPTRVDTIVHFNG